MRKFTYYSQQTQNMYQGHKMYFLNAAITNKTSAYGVLIVISNVNLISVRQGQIKCVGGLSRSFVIVYNIKK